jgi:dTDP-4-amino-4,6-dideoxygalactose transaminase
MIRKKQLSDLSIFGGSPVFNEKLHVGRPNIGNRENLMERINNLLDRKWLTNNGPFVQEFEQRIADFVGVKHCIAMCNGTVALEIAIRASGLKGEIIVPSLTFVATAHALQWQEITPVFCDIDPASYNLNPLCIHKMITPRTTGIIGVHLWGRPCDIEKLIEISDSYNLKLLFDSAHAFGCSYKGRMIGSFGNAEVFSFHATKFFNTFEGGAVVTNDDELAKKIRLMKNFGFEGYDNVIYIGTNGKMSEVSAAMGLTNLENLDEFVAINHRNYKLYQSELKNIPGIKLIKYDKNEHCNYQYIVIEVDENVTHVSRDHLIDILHSENILARRYFYPGCHRMEPYCSYFPHSHFLLPETVRVAECVLSLPTGTSIGEDEITHISQILRLVIENGSKVSQRLELHSDLKAINY